MRRPVLRGRPWRAKAGVPAGSRRYCHRTSPGTCSCTPTHERCTPDWVAAADEQVSRLHAATARRRDDDDFAALMGELRTEPDFEERWSLFATTEKRRGTTGFVHPAIGRLRLNYEVLLLPDDVDEQRPITWLPADDATALAVERISDAAVPTSPAQLRVIG